MLMVLRRRRRPLVLVPGGQTDPNVQPPLITLDVDLREPLMLLLLLPLLLLPLLLHVLLRVVLLAKLLRDGQALLLLLLATSNLLLLLLPLPFEYLHALWQNNSIIWVFKPGRVAVGGGDLVPVGVVWYGMVW